MLIKKVDRYILSEILSPFLGGLVFFVFVFLMFQVLRLADFFIIHGTPLTVLGKLVGLMILSFLPLAVPIAFLVSVLTGFGRLSSDSELVALKAGGLPLWRMAFPVIAFGSVLFAFSFYLNRDWVPAAERAFKAQLLKISNTEVVSNIREGTFNSDFFGLLIYVDRTNDQDNSLERVFIFDEREPKSPLVVVSKTGNITPILQGTDLGAALLLELSQGNIHQTSGEVESYTKIDFDQYQLFLEVQEGAAQEFIKPKMLTWDQIKDGIENSKSQKKKRSEHLITEYWRRISYASIPFAFIPLGIGLGTVRTRATRAGATVVTVVIVVIYWTLLTWMTALSQQGTIPGWISMMIPNWVSLIAGIYFFRKASW